MCNSKMKSSHANALADVANINGRPVLQPTSNRVATLEPNKPVKKSLQRSLSSPMSITVTKTTAKVTTLPISPKPKPIKRAKDTYSPNSSTEKPIIPKPTVNPVPVIRKKSKTLETSLSFKNDSTSYESLLVDRAPGSIAAAQREQASVMQARRKMKIAHYGRTPEKLEKIAPVIDITDSEAADSQEEKRCSFITPNSDPLYVAYHDEEWGVPVHDDKMLFELLVLSGAQVGLDWTTILKKRNDFRSAFAGFDADVVCKFTEKQIASISSDYGLDLGRVRGVVDNSNRILEVRKEFGSLDKYLWCFVNHKPISTNYKSCRKIPVKTSKSEMISRDMVRRGFRFVGPTVIHSFMQAAGLTNDHLISCRRHLHCSS
ncbi:uncharacterized protein A4U43_C07F38310 [Asparagus officinalis]|uniref:DNA-3-methyladenine glycosylase I n=1 Tax=Asparagus officinalis TaxID=4686 RepID=A0A5P1EI54_ASPOF|nr:uncharacterized protein LOC109850221 [Asparagus officinalis]ONK65556.1 uncharacterized protein A4U43_C07F38310 [Asparagus officinalis]